MERISTTIKLKPATLERIKRLFESEFGQNSHIAQKLAKRATWEFRIVTIIERLEAKEDENHGVE